MLLDPGAWLVQVMQLTPMDTEFEVQILGLVFVGFLCAWVAEGRAFFVDCPSTGKGLQLYFSPAPENEERIQEAADGHADIVSGRNHCCFSGFNKAFVKLLAL